jgi:hypothetical protein
VKTAQELETCFFTELKKYNSTNYNTLLNADLSKNDAKTHKSFSSVITRYFIFREKHAEFSEAEFNLLYFKLKLDLISDYFAQYPDSSTDTLVAFQQELRKFAKLQKESKGE